jgi:hypothetical protein
MTKAALKIIKQVLASVGFGTLLFAAWVGIIIYTSTDFPHEGPDSAWFAPLDWWTGVLRWLGIPRLFGALGSAVETAVSLFVIAAPFIALFSVISFFALRFLKRRRMQKPLA